MKKAILMMGTALALARVFAGGARLSPVADAEGKPYLHPRSPCPMYDWKGPETAGVASLRMSLRAFSRPRPSAREGPLRC